MANNADLDQLALKPTASKEANWSGSTLFAKAEYIRAQQDNGLNNLTLNSKTLVHVQYLIILDYFLHFFIKISLEVPRWGPSNE